MLRLLVFAFILTSTKTVSYASADFPLIIFRSRGFNSFYVQYLLVSPFNRSCIPKSHGDLIRFHQPADHDFKRDARQLAMNIDGYGGEHKSCVEFVDGVGSSDKPAHLSQLERKKAKARARKRILLMIVAILYGAQYSAQTLLQRELPSSSVSLIRFVCASLIFLPKSIQYLFHMYKNLRSNREHYEGSKRLALGPIWVLHGPSFT